MARKSYAAEQIIVKLQKIEVLYEQGRTVAEAVRQEEITEQTYYRRRKQYGGMSTSDVQKLKLLEKENLRLRRIISNKALNIEIPKDVNSKNF